jgi:hypothetical protein
MGESWGVRSYADAEAADAAEAANRNAAGTTGPVAIKRDGEGAPEPKRRAEPDPVDDSDERKQRSAAAKHLSALGVAARRAKRAAAAKAHG